MQSYNLIENVVYDHLATKQAALFFDHVIPLEGVQGFHVLDFDNVDSFRNWEDIDTDAAKLIIRELLPPNFGTQEQIEDFLHLGVGGVSLMHIARGFYNCEPVFKKTDQYINLLSEINAFKRFPFDQTPATFAQAFLESDGSDECDAGTISPLVSIANMLIPDTSRLNWDKIIEFRKDPAAKQRLRRLRVFATKEYEGKSRAFIEDDLCLRMNDYQQTLKDWTIETILGTFSTVFKVEKALASGLAAAVSAYAGVSPLGLAAATIAIPIGTIAVELGSRHLAKTQLVRRFPLAYLQDVSASSGNSITTPFA